MIPATPLWLPRKGAGGRFAGIRSLLQASAQASKRGVRGGKSRGCTHSHPFSPRMARGGGAMGKTLVSPDLEMIMRICLSELVRKSASH